MKIYRIAKEKYAKDLSGTGAKLYGGRWNPKGVAVLYAAEHKSLAALEVLVHLNRDTVPDELKLITIDIPDNEVANFDVKKFKKINESISSYSQFKEEGREWVESNRSLALRIPSVLIPGEFNILINVDHKSFKKVKIKLLEDFVFDERFFM